MLSELLDAIYYDDNERLIKWISIIFANSY